MPDIDYNACSMDDVIARSCLLHPTLFAERLDAVAKIHNEALRTLRDSVARKTAESMRDHATTMAATIREAGAMIDCNALEFSARIIAFSAAAKLQCLTPAITNGIAAREV